jgi:protein-L-isoaspartate(D-aspartate) O-methyltransferase
MSESARFNMVETQIRPADVTDPQVLAAMNAVPRERFVPSAAVALAYADVPVQIAPGRYLLDPRSVAQLLQLAEGGRLVTFLKDGQSRAWLFLMEKGQVGKRPDFDADVPVLAGFRRAVGFVF